MAIKITHTLCQPWGFWGSRIIGGPWTFTVEITEYATGAAGWKILFYDKNDKTQKVGELSSDMGQGIISSIEFNWVKAGCGDFKLIWGKDPTTLPFTVEYNQGIEIYLYHDVSPWYAGYILSMPVQGTTDRPWEITGAGYYNQLESCIVNKNYTSIEIANTVRDILATIVEPKTDIVYADYKIVQTPYSIFDIRFDYTKAKKALSQLCDLAQNYMFGVDEYREFFFHGTEPEINPCAIFMVGKDISEVKISEDTEGVANKIYIKAGLLSGSPKTNIQAEVSDYNSQVLYGLREEVMTSPSIRDADDAERWGLWKLADSKLPKKKGKIPWLDSSRGLIKAKGKARILTLKDQWEGGGVEFEKEVDHMNLIIPEGGGWVGDPTCTESSDTVVYQEGGVAYKFDWTAAPASTFKMKKGFLLDQYEDWSKFKYIRFWIRSAFPSGTWTFYFGESDYEDQGPFDFTSQVSAGPAAWYAIEIDISSVSPANRNNVQYIQVKWSGSSIEGPDTWLDFMRGVKFEPLETAIEVPIEKVSYKVDSSGIVCSLDLGDTERTPGKILRDIIFDIMNEELLQQANMKQV